MPSAQKGFTLIEVLLVIVVLLMVSAMAIPSFTRSFAQLQLHDVTNDLAYLMRYAQSRAIYTQRPVKLMFDDPATRYWLEQASDNEEEFEDEEPRNYEPVTGRLGRVSKIPEDITISGTPSVTFNTDGKVEKTQISVCQKDQCLIISTQNQSGNIVVAAEKSE